MGVDISKSSWLGKTSKKRIERRLKLLKSYLKRKGFAGVWLSRQECQEIVDLIESNKNE